MLTKVSKIAIFRRCPSPFTSSFANPLIGNSPARQQIMLEDKDYFQEVYRVVREVPKGRVTTYGAIARYLSLRAGARMVGWAMTASHGHDVPAHRVINSVGVLSGKHFFGSPTAMQELLEAEGVKVENDRVVDFKTRLWDPSVELAV